MVDKPFKERGRQPRHPKVETSQIRAISEDQLFQAQNFGRQRTTREDISVAGQSLGEGIQSGVVEHTRPDTVTMWKPSARHGYTPRLVSVSAITELLRMGWRSVCPHCNGQHSSDPNSCPGREPVKLRVCPVCGKRVYDNLGFDEFIQSDDPNVIQDDSYTATTPEQRTKTQLDLHLWLKHPRQAQVMNVPPLPGPLRDMADASGAL